MASLNKNASHCPRADHLACDTLAAANGRGRKETGTATERVVKLVLSAARELVRVEVFDTIVICSLDMGFGRRCMRLFQSGIVL
jgi:hypothetical protein